MTRSSISVEQEHLIKTFRRFGVGVLVCGILFSMDRIGMLVVVRGGLERGIITIDNQIIRAQRWMYQPVDWILSSRDKTVRLASLEDRLSRVSVAAERLEALEARVKTLESLAVRVTSEKKAERIAQLVDYGDRMMVAAGTGDSIRSGQVVTDEEGVLLGRVLQIGTYMSEVVGLSDAGSFVQVQTISGSTRGIVEGKGGNVVLTGVLQSELLSVGDILVTTGTNTLFPPGLVVGQVTAITGNPEDVTKGAEVALLAHRSDWVALW